MPGSSSESSAQRRKIFVHSVLAQLAAAVYGSSSGKDSGSTISGNLARKVYARIAAILQRFVSIIMICFMDIKSH